MDTLSVSLQTHEMDARLRSTPVYALILLAVALALTGCASGAGEPTPESMTGGTAAPEAAPVGEDPAMEPGPPSTDPDPSPSPSESPSEPPSPEDRPKGCPANNETIPGGADIATIPDIDGDGQPDIHFYSEIPNFMYGVQTATGATIILRDQLAGPHTHSGWTAQLGSDLVITVLDDGRTASLHAFVDCRFVTTTDLDGTPYVFGLNGFSDDNTAVRCGNGDGGLELIGVNAARQPDTTYDIVNTTITISRDGKRVVHTSAQTEETGLVASDERVTSARNSTCADVPKVGSIGR
jgi:hypothetical protein